MRIYVVKDPTNYLHKNHQFSVLLSKFSNTTTISNNTHMIVECLFDTRKTKA